MQTIKLDSNQKKQVPKTAKGRIKELMKLSLPEKVNFLPPAKHQFQMGPYIYEVAVVHAGKLRFTAKLVDVNIEYESPIIDPKTQKPFVQL